MVVFLKFRSLCNTLLLYCHTIYGQHTVVTRLLRVPNKKKEGILKGYSVRNKSRGKNIHFDSEFLWNRLQYIDH